MMQDIKIGKLVLLRHGESEFNFANKFSGWSDTALTTCGKEQAKLAGARLQTAGFVFDKVLSSCLQRAYCTAEIALEEMGISVENIQRDWRLNERHYGVLQEQDKGALAGLYGDEQLQAWRKSFTSQPPELASHDVRHKQYQELFHFIPEADFPRSESLAMLQARLMTMWQSVIHPALLSGQHLLLAIHGDVIRILLKIFSEQLQAKHVGRQKDDDFIHLVIPNCEMFVCEVQDRSVSEAVWHRWI